MSIRYQIIMAGGVYDYQLGRRITTDDAAQWAEYSAWLTAGNRPLPPDNVTGDDLATAQAKRIADINGYSAGLRNHVVAGRSPAEMASWSLKLFDALAVAAGQPSPFASVLPQIGAALGLPATPASYCAAVAAVRGITEAAQVEKVLAQAVPFLVAEAALDGVRGRKCDETAALTTVQDIIVHPWLAGWPEL
jgi:hypothetical protein